MLIDLINVGDGNISDGINFMMNIIVIIIESVLLCNLFVYMYPLLYNVPYLIYSFLFKQCTYTS